MVEDLLDSEVVVCWVALSSTLEDTPRGARLVRDIERRGIDRRSTTDRDFHELALTETSQGVIAVAEIPHAEYEDLDLRVEPVVILVLDAVQDPGNFGTLVRSAEAFGAAGVIALPGTVEPWNPKAVRAAAGASFRLPIVRSDWQTARTRLRDRGFAFLAADAEGGTELPAELDRLALVVGNEGGGLSAAVRAGVDRLVAIPMRGRAESLNVSAAAAILLYELSGSKRRRS